MKKNIAFITLVIGLIIALFMMYREKKHNYYSDNFSSLENNYIKDQITKNKVSSKKLVDDALKDAGEVAKNAQFTAQETQMLIDDAKKIR